MATHSSVLAWRIPGTGEPGGLPSMGSHRIGHNWSDLAAAAVSYWKQQNTDFIIYKHFSQRKDVLRPKYIADSYFLLWNKTYTFEHTTLHSSARLKASSPAFQNILPLKSLPTIIQQRQNFLLKISIKFVHIALDWRSKKVLSYSLLNFVLPVNQESLNFTVKRTYC